MRTWLVNFAVRLQYNWKLKLLALALSLLLWFYLNRSVS